MARKWFEVEMTFTYANGEPGGRLHTVVNSTRAVTVQIEADRNWLSAKGHKEESLVVREYGGGRWQ